MENFRVFIAAVEDPENPELVAKLKKLFRNGDEKTVFSLLSDLPVVLAKNVDKTTADRIKVYLEKAGAEIIIKPITLNQDVGSDGSTSMHSPASADVEQNVFCTACGAQNPGNSLYCSACGQPINRINAAESSYKRAGGARNARDDLQEYYEEALGYKNQNYYIPRFNRFDRDGISASWNWPAFFFSFWWLLYRKVWGWALLYFGVNFFLSLVTPSLLPSAAIGGASAGSVHAYLLISLINLVAIYIVFPMYANAIYYKHLTKKIQKIRSQSISKEKKLRMVAAEGGTSNVIVIIIAIFMFVAIIGILAAIAIPAYQDYTSRVKVAEGLSLGTEYKKGVEEYNYEHHRWPSSNADIGIRQQIYSNNVESISVKQNGVVVITYADGLQLNGKSIALVPHIDGENRISWECQGVDMENRLLPRECRIY